MSITYDYKAEFHDAVTDLIAQGIEDRTERMAAVNALTDAYIDSVGVPPDGAELERLTDYTLREELTDRHPDKVTRDEYPFFSAWQLGLRRDKETGMGAAEHVGVDGIDYRPATRRRRTSYENWYVDANAKILNKERARRYRRYTRPGYVKKYNIRENGGIWTKEFKATGGIVLRWRTFILASNEEVITPEKDSKEAA